jgi:shikimate kinase
MAVPWIEPRNIVLIGFMGAGKSSVGRDLAHHYKFRFLDTDSMIRQKYGKSIPEIFAQLGEETFRADEHAALLHLQRARGIVLATGGGIILRPENHPLLKNIGYVVWLTADEETIWNRVGLNPNRPLLQTENPRETISRLLEYRSPFYQEAADLKVNTTGLTHSEVVQRILYSTSSKRLDEGEH